MGIRRKSLNRTDRNKRKDILESSFEQIKDSLNSPYEFFVDGKH